MDASAARKNLSKYLAALRRADKALAAAGALPDDLSESGYAADDAAASLREAVTELRSSQALAAIDQYCSSLESRVRLVIDDAAARLASGVAKRLAEVAPVTGQLPELRWGLLRLEFRLRTAKRGVVIWYGPKIAALAKVGTEPAEIADAALTANESLARAPFDPAAFSDQLRAAYERARRRLDLARGAPAPILSVLGDLVQLRQSPAFVADPIRENFRSYGRVQFSYDLHRSAPLPGIALGVAAHAQTKRPQDHLWVPTSASGEGTHFATLAVRNG